MNNSIRTTLLCILLSFGISLYAYDFELNGISYEILNSTSVRVETASNFIGEDLYLPETVEFEGKKYTVVSINADFRTRLKYIWDDDIIGYISHGTYVKRLYIPKTITRICTNLDNQFLWHISGDYELVKGDVIKWNTGVSEIHVSKDNPIYASIDGVLFDKDLKTLLCFPRSNQQKKYKIPDGVEEIYERAFENAPFIESIEMPNSLKYIRRDGFSSCEKLSEVVNWSNSLELLDTDAFEGAALTLAKLPATLKEIGDDALNCYSAKSAMTVYCEGSVPATQKEYKGDEQPVSDETLEYGILYVPKGSLSKYQRAKGWCKFKYIEEYDCPETPTDVDGTKKDVIISYLDKDGVSIKDEGLTINLPKLKPIDGLRFIKWVVIGGDLDQGIKIQAIYVEDAQDSIISVNNEERHTATRKIIKDNKIFIVKGNKVYDMSGVEIQ